MHRILIFAIAVLMGMGVGGGGLLVIYLVMLQGVEQLTAQGINLFFFVACASASMLIHLRRRRIRWHLLWGAIPGCLASWLASGVADRIPAHTLRALFGALLCLCGLAGLWGAFFGKAGKNRQKREK